LGRRSRKARPSGADGMRRGYARSEERNARVRATLTPLAPGERPPALVVAAALAAVLALANVAAWAAGLDVEGQKPGALGVLLFAGLMLVAAWGMWQRRYWAVLGFEALLGITLAVAGLSVLVASNLAALALCATILVFGGWLFWKLVRVMGRLQAAQHVR
jgi:hypothetical protein